MAISSGTIFHLAWRHAGKVPGPLLRGLITLGADVACLAGAGGVGQLRKNLARVRPEATERELRALTRAGMRSYMRYYGEAFVLRHARPAQIEARVRLENYDECSQFIAAGVTPVLALTHQGNWDLAGVYASKHIAPVLTVAERLEPPEVYQEFLAFRQGLGMEILTAGDPGVFRELMRAARGGASDGNASGARIVCLLADRDLSRNGIEVDYLGHRARVAAGPAALAVACGAPLIPAGIFYERLTGARRRAAGTPWGIVIRFHPPVAVATEGSKNERIAAMTQGWVSALSEDIREFPQDWHMLQKVFIDDLDADRYARSTAAAQADQPLPERQETE
ncbi:KDO2-lipid IV(A) lauroyltransferase [Sanguibacter gelidistatuariae]|uniref:KDO2-lipid IV(A) lauroyltransferase n=1 Tax=Sanguibacter gelidistatuariae TaxID=1814289 RepID=A0A1G6JX36_9MICO|nr:phosphatidylinositol mannoside acyltransferase [Sanguibacter gelidistatuariae]SDC23322.1 KDO2-lipid IV(A) lauroyltransferase [Sanguibacter gelidistatuariae]